MTVQKNFAGSSKAMEQESTKRMWARSVNHHQVRYIEMLSDGDSAAFREVGALNPYPGHDIVKLECINHAHKRMGTALRKLSAQGKLGGKGVGKLTANKCKTLTAPCTPGAIPPGVGIGKHLVAINTMLETF